MNPSVDFAEATDKQREAALEGAEPVPLPEGPQAITTLGDQWPEYMAELKRRADGFDPVPTGLPRLDAKLGGGIPPGQVTLLPGATGLGKTSFALQVARRYATPDMAGRSCVYWTLELSRWDIISRLVGQENGLSWMEVVTGKQQAAAKATGRRLGEVLLVVHEWSTGLAAVEEDLKRLADLTGKPPLLVVDYVQLLAEPGHETRQSVEQQSGELRKLAQQEGIAVLELSSVGRQSGTWSSGAAKDLDRILIAAKESGRLEFDCSVLLSLKRRGHTTPSGSHHPMWLAIAKNRFAGGLGFSAVMFDGLAGVFSEADDDAAGMPSSNRDLQAKVLASIKDAHESGKPITSQNALRAAVGAAQARVKGALETLMESGQVVKDGKNYRLAPDGPGEGA